MIGIILMLSNNRASCVVLLLVLSGNICFLAGTAAFDRYYAGLASWESAPELKHIYLQMSLALENNLAA